MRLLSRAVVVLIAVCAAVASFLGGPLAVSATAENVPTCRVGAYLSDLYDLDSSKSKFSARVWIWSLCPDKSLDPLPGMSFPNSYGPKFNNSRETFEAGNYRHSELVQGEFRQRWDERDYPFDRQKLQILITAPQDIEHFSFTPDTRNSSAADFEVPGWRLTAFRVSTYKQHYTSNFGNETLPVNAGSVSSRIRLEIDLARSDQINFLKFLGPLFIIFLITISTFMVRSIEAPRFNSRITVLGAALFAVLVNMQRSDNVIISGGVTLLDQLHILNLLWILVAIVITSLAWHWSARNVDENRVRRLDVRTMLYGSSTCLLAGIALVLIAAGKG